MRSAKAGYQNKSGVPKSGVPKIFPGKVGYQDPHFPHKVGYQDIPEHKLSQNRHAGKRESLSVSH